MVLGTVHPTAECSVGFPVKPMQPYASCSTVVFVGSVWRKTVQKYKTGEKILEAEHRVSLAPAATPGWRDFQERTARATEEMALAT